MFAILINDTTAPLIAAMNGGVTPEVENEETYFVYESEDTIPYIIHSDELLARRHEDDDWNMIHFGIWTK